MSKQIYIDSQGNENLISGTINTGETLPLTTNPSDGTVSEAIGDLSALTTTNNDSLVDAVNSFLPKQVYKNLNWENLHSFDADLNTLYLLTADSGNDMAIARIFSNGTTNLGVVSGSKITALTYQDGKLRITTNNCGLVAIRIA